MERAAAVASRRREAAPAASLSRRAAVLAPLAMLAACATSRFTPRAVALPGRVWDVASRRFVAPSDACAQIAGAQVALLGETHDNPLHHQIQRAILEAMVRAGKRPAIAMEQIDVEWQGDVDRAIARGATAEAIATAGHVSRGWDWTLYAPIAAFAIERGLPLVALGLSRDRTRAIISRGLDALGTGEAARLALDRTWSATRNATLRAEIVQGHCGEDTPIVGKLVDVQRAKDAVMADRILAHAAKGVAAILGRGHVRKDLDVTLYLAARDPRLHVVALALVEEDPQAKAAEDYAEAAPGRFDLVWFTPRAAREDPCAAFKGLPASR